MKTTDIKTLTPEQLAAKVSQLESQLAECLGEQPEGENRRKNSILMDHELWLCIERTLAYEIEYVDSYKYLVNDTVRDCALLGRIAQEVAFAHRVRNSDSDFAPGHRAGQSLSDEQNEEIFFFIDRLSSMLHTLQSAFQELYMNEKPIYKKPKV